jgi:hypothetical protein
VTALTRLLHALDVLDWPAARACLADTLRTDYTPLFGGEPETVTGDALIAQWQGLLPGFSATQHLTGPVLEVADTLETHVRAIHWMSGARWAVYGHYSAHVGAHGRIDSLTLRTFQVEGDTDLPGRASTNPERRKPTRSV